MFPVEIHIRGRNEDALTARMTAMREWLDHHRSEPSKFLYTFVASGILFQVDFPVEAEAVAFAREFGGCVTAAPADMSPQAADRQMADG
jgi:hypothetical protein